MSDHSDPGELEAAEYFGKSASNYLSDAANEINIDEVDTTLPTWCGTCGAFSQSGESCTRCNDLVCIWCGTLEVPSDAKKGDVCQSKGWDSHWMEYRPCRGHYDTRVERRRMVSIKKQWGRYGMPPKGHPLWDIK